MKKRLILFALVLGLSMLVCAFAQAAEADNGPQFGYRTFSVESAYEEVIRFEMLDADEATVNESADVPGQYPGAVKVSLTYTHPVQSKEYMLFVLTGDDRSPNVDNIAYVDQLSASEDSIEFIIYPKQVEEGTGVVAYSVYMSSDVDAATVTEDSTAITNYVKVASFEYYSTEQTTDYILGDVDGDGEPTSNDALMIMEYEAGLIDSLG